MTKVRDREQLVAVATRVFADKGFDAARLEDIATELGVLKGSLYYHISSKAELLYLVLRRIVEPMVDGLEHIAASEASPRRKLEAAVLEHMRRIGENPPRSSLLFERLSLLSDEQRAEMQGLYRRYEQLLLGVLQEGIADGELRPDLDVKMAMRAILGMCNWTSRWYRRDGRLAGEEIGRVFVHILLDGLQSPRAAGGTLPAERTEAGSTPRPVVSRQARGRHSSTEPVEGTGLRLRPRSR